MRRFIWFLIVAFSASVLVLGCGKTEEPKPKQSAQQAAPATKKEAEKKESTEAAKPSESKPKDTLPGEAKPAAEKPGDEKK